MIHGEVTHGGIKRVFAEKINGSYQGAVFRFTQGLEAGINRLAWGPDGALYAGGVGSTGNWGHSGKLSYGLQRLTFNNKTTFEMLALRAKPNGIEIEFTEPLKEGLGTKASDYSIRQFYYKPTGDYGGPKLDDKPLHVNKVQLSADRRKVLLELAGMKPRHVIYVRLNRKTLTSQSGQHLWSTEAWYTMNSIPVNQ
jgi:cytochrome c